MRYVLLPSRGLHFEDDVTDDTLQARVREVHSDPAAFTLVARARRNGPRLVEAAPELADRFRARHPDLKLAPELLYRPASLNPARDVAPEAPSTSGETTVVSLRVLAASDSTPVAGAQVAVVTNLTTGQGAAGNTDGDGRVSLTLNGTVQSIPLLYVVPESAFWSYLAENSAVADTLTIRVAPVDLGFEDVRGYFYGLVPESAGTGVKVGVVDSGIAQHPDLVVVGGENVVPGADPNDYRSDTLGHGTHIAGTIAGRGTPSKGVRGVAPGVSLYSYRVFPPNSGSCSSFAVTRAIEQAVFDGCDIINASLSLSDAQDEAVEAALAEARAQGSLVLAASGNTTFGPRGAVDYPASDPVAIAVSAMGRIGFYPSGTLEVAEVDTPFGTDASNFVARFSNVGSQIAYTEPGVGIISTFPGGYAVMDGTSMACGVASGRAAALLAAHPDILAMPRTAVRAEALLAVLTQGAASMGFGAAFEGHGRL
jgi:subtilisin